MFEKSKYLPHFFLLIYAIECTFLAIQPYDRAVWWAENLPVFILAAVLIFTFKVFRFSNLSYFLIMSFCLFHVVGGHYSFEKVPFDFFNNLLASFNMNFLFPAGRNNFDRVGHFLVGIFAYPVAELLLRKKWVSHIAVAIFVGIIALGFWGALYEIIEMYYAILEGGKAGAAFLGSQGDVWDAQKDMLLDLLGAVCVFVVCGFTLKRFRSNSLTSKI